MVNEIRTYGDGWTLYQNDAKTVDRAERKQHGQTFLNNNTQKKLNEKNADAYTAFVDMLEHDDKNGNIDLYIVNRTVDGKKISKENGLSYLIGDMGMKLAKAGYFKDVDEQGFTAQNAKDLGVAIAQHYEKGDNYLDKLFTRDGKHFRINKENLIGLLEKAGWVREKTEVQQTQQETTEQPEVVEQQAEETVGDFSVGTDEEITSKEPQRILNTIIEKLNIKDDENVHIDFGGKAIEADGETTAEEVKFTYNGKQYVYKNGDVEELEVVDEEVDAPKVNRDNDKYITRYNEKTGTYQQKKKGLFHRWHDVDSK